VHDQLLTRLETERGLETSTLRWLSIREFEAYLVDGSLPSITPRRSFLLVEDSVDGERVFDDPAALEQFPFLNEAIDPEITEVKGQTASPGKVQGRVRILLKVDQLGDFQPGEILLASMTDPRYLPAMKKAAAIVTNEGGITCHAAIVARELRIPCVIATKFATKVLKDGDMVEVNADKGEVKIL
jgi:phosphohistidine swiveling domain-containing protein